MQCANCGRPLHAHETLCPFCGEPVLTPAAAATGHDASPGGPTALGSRRALHPSGPPVDTYAPTIYGPPVGPERYARVYSALDVPSVRRVHGYRVIAPPAQLASARRSGCLTGLAVVASLAVLLVLGGGALAATGHRLPGLSPLLGAQQVPAATATVHPSSTPGCQAAAVDPTAAKALDQIVLTTGVSGAALKPVDKVTAFTVGQTMHVVFHIRATVVGTVDAKFCSNGAVSVTNSPLVVPTGYASRLGANARGQFYLTLEPGSAGSGLVMLTWNGHVAAVVPFSVRAG